MDPSTPQHREVEDLMLRPTDKCPIPSILNTIRKSLGLRVVAMCPAAMHPFNVPEEYKSIYKLYEETWTGAPMQDGESMVVFYSECKGLGGKAVRRSLRSRTQITTGAPSKKPIHMFSLVSTQVCATFRQPTYLSAASTQYATMAQ